MVNSNNDRRRMTTVCYLIDEAEYLEFEVLPFIPYGDIYRARLKHMIATRRDEAKRLEIQVYQILKGEREQ